MTQNKTEYTPTEALKCLSGVSRNALYKSMANGDVSYIDKQWGQKKRRYIQGAELARFYGDSFKPQHLGGTTQQNETVQPDTKQGNPKTTIKNIDLDNNAMILRERLKMVEEKTEFFGAIIEEQKTRIENLENDKDAWKVQAQKNIELLEDHRIKEKEKPSHNPVQEEKQNFDSRGDKKGLKALTGAEIAIILLLITLSVLLILILNPSILIAV